MKKLLMIVVVSMIAVSLIFIGTSCKPDAVEETTEETTEVTEEDTGETLDGKVVAEEKEKYIALSAVWGMDVWQYTKLGVMTAAEYWSDELEVEYMGTMDGDMDKFIVAVEQAVSMNPDGIMIYNFSVGEASFIQDYYDNGGIVGAFHGQPPAEFDFTTTAGPDMYQNGQQLALWFLERYGKTSGKIGIETMSEIKGHIDRRMGIESVLKDTDIEIVMPYIEETHSAEGCAENAAAFVAANPDVDGFICTASLGAAAIATALKEQGVKPGEKLIVGCDVSPDTAALMEEGYIQDLLTIDFIGDAFYLLTLMHLINDNIAFTTKDDAAAGVRPSPRQLMCDVVRVTPENISGFLDMPSPDDWPDNLHPKKR